MDINVFATWKLSTLLQLYSQDGEIEISISSKEHTNV